MFADIVMLIHKSNINTQYEFLFREMMIQECNIMREQIIQASFQKVIVAD